jgi:hypothetical protein
MTTGRINQVTIVSYTPAHMGHRVVATGAPRGPSAAGRFFLLRGVFLLLGKLLPGNSRPRGQPIQRVKGTTDIPRSHKFPRHSGPPLVRETPPPQGEDCRKTGDARGANQVQADLRMVSILRSGLTHQQVTHILRRSENTRHKRTVPDHNQAPDGFAQGIIPHGTNPPEEARPSCTYLYQEDTGRYFFFPISSQQFLHPSTRSRCVNGSIQGWPAIPPEREKETSTPM